LLRKNISYYPYMQLYHFKSIICWDVTLCSSTVGYNISEKHWQTWRMPFSGMLCHVALVRTDILEECSAFIIRVTRISELGTMLAVTSNRCMLQRNTILSPWRWWCYTPLKCWFLQEPHGVTSQKSAFFIVTATESSNFTMTNFYTVSQSRK
jgi:hypothetical protein